MKEDQKRGIKWKWKRKGLKRKEQRRERAKVKEEKEMRIENDSSLGRISPTQTVKGLE